MVRAVVLLALLAISSTASAIDFKTEIASIETRIGGRIGVAAMEIASGKRIDYRQNERFLMCSTFKFLAAAAILQRIDQKREQPDRFVRYTAADILEYAPVTKEHLKDGGMTLKDLCVAAIEQSDNTAGNLLLDAIGGPAGLTSFARSLGDTITRLDRKEPDLNVGDPGDERDTTSASAMLADMRRLLAGEVLAPSSRGQLEVWLRNSVTGKSMIRAGVPAAWMVGDKTGRNSKGATNDIAIIRPSGRSPILLAIYTAGSTGSAEERDAAVAEITRIVLASM